MLAALKGQLNHCLSLFLIISLILAPLALLGLGVESNAEAVQWMCVHIFGETLAVFPKLLLPWNAFWGYCATQYGMVGNRMRIGEIVNIFHVNMANAHLSRGHLFTWSDQVDSHHLKIPKGLDTWDLPAIVPERQCFIVPSSQWVNKYQWRCFYFSGLHLHIDCLLIVSISISTTVYEFSLHFNYLCIFIVFNKIYIFICCTDISPGKGEPKSLLRPLYLGNPEKGCQQLK